MFLSWLVTQVELILLILIFVIAISYFHDLEAVCLLCGFLLVLHIHIFVTASFTIGFYVVLLSDPDPEVQTIWILVLLAISLTFALSVAIYSFINFEDTVSRRTLFRTSRVDLYESRMTYAIAKFFSTALCSTALFGLILGILINLW